MAIGGTGLLSIKDIVLIKIITENTYHHYNPNELTTTQ